MRFAYSDYDPTVTIGCDGLPPARLTLSHWPGNRTPTDLKRPLSTGIALAFVALTSEERERRFGKFEIVTNDHFDTDGVLSIFTCLHPQAALAQEELLLAAAAAGDYWTAPTRRAAAIDMAISCYDDADRSPVGAASSYSSRDAYTAACFEDVFARLPQILSDPWKSGMNINAEFARLELELTELHNCTSPPQHVPDVDLCSVRARRSIDPRAIFEMAQTDRVLAIESAPEGSYVTLRLSSLSWFDTTRDRKLARPNLKELASRLGQAERGTGSWLESGAGDPFGLLYYGLENPQNSVRSEPGELQPSTQGPETIEKIIIQYLRERSL